MPYTLTDDDRKSYEKDGYLLVHHPIFSEERFAKLKKLVDESFAARRGPDGEEPQLIDCPHWTDERMFEWLLSDEMLGLVEPLIGPDIAIFACHFLRKPPGVGKRVPWHEDSAYWKGRLDPMIVASLTIGIDPATPDNGCMRVIPGTHVDGYSNYIPVANAGEQVFPIEIQQQIDESKAVEMAIEANEAFLHEGRIIHGSNANRSNLQRTAFAVRYFPAHVRFVEEQNPNFHVYMARGRNLAGNRYAEPGG